MTVVWTDPALEQLDALRTARGSAGSPLAGRIARRVSELERLPYLGSEVADYADPALRELHEPPYRILYRVRDESVEVILLWHSSRKLPRTPPG